MFVRRIGPSPKDLYGPKTPAADGCPDIWELEDGDFAIIGFAGDHLASALPDGASCGSDERIIKLPRATLIAAKGDIPSA